MPNVPLILSMGSDAFILGYPFGISLGTFPIWKRGSIATEPDLAGAAGNPHFFLLDTASRPGMSGSPVILRTVSAAAMERGNLTLSTGTNTRLIGVYSGRLPANEPLDAQLGMVWPISLAEEIVAHGILDADA
jgi:hypothetical protein